MILIMAMRSRRERPRIGRGIKKIDMDQVKISKESIVGFAVLHQVDKTLLKVLESLAFSDKEIPLSLFDDIAAAKLSEIVKKLEEQKIISCHVYNVINVTIEVKKLIKEAIVDDRWPM